jgi:gentisate 1,2-dioxygenase
MVSRTTTKVSHYHVQKNRRANFIEEWRGYQKTVVALENVPMVQTARGTRVGVYVGSDGDRPTRSMDALAHEIDPGVVSTVHRHSWDAMVLVVAGRGWIGAQGIRYTFRRGHGTGRGTTAT